MTTVKSALLAQAASINPRMSDRLGDDDGISFVPMAALSAENAKVVEVVGRPYGEVKKGYTYFETGDVLVAKITPCFENGKIAQAKLPSKIGFGSTEFHVIRPKADVSDGRYLHHYLRQPQIREAGERRMTGSGGQRRVPESFLASLTVPLPPVPEQCRIASILDQSDALAAQRRQALTELDNLAHAVFVEMFGDAVANSKGWPETHKLGEVADIASGITKGRKVGDARTRSVPYLAVANVQDKALNLVRVKEIDATDAEIARYKLRRHDLLLTEGGDPDKLGRGTLWNNEMPECIHQNHIFRVRLTHTGISPQFLTWLVSSPRGKAYFLRSAKQTTGIASINMTQLRDFPLLLPPIALQQDFATRVEAIESLRAANRLALSESDALFASLQHLAFTGGL